MSFSKNGFKYFIGYEDAKTIRPLCFFLLKWVHIEKILIKQNVYLLTEELWLKYNETC